MMFTDDCIMEIDLSGIDPDDLAGDGWAIIHLTPDGVYLKGLHYVVDKDFHYSDYIAENDIGDNDMIMYGKVEGHALKVTDLLK